MFLLSCHLQTIAVLRLWGGGAQDPGDYVSRGGFAFERQVSQRRWMLFLSVEAEASRW